MGGTGNICGSLKGFFITMATLLVVLGIFLASPANAGLNQWTSIGPEGGKINALAIDPTNSQTIYAGTDGGGVFKSTNGGTSWSVVNVGLTNNYVISLAIDPTNNQTIYAGTVGDANHSLVGGVFKSTNGGTSWSEVNSGLTYSIVKSLAIDPTNSQTIYAGTYGTGVFKSINGGATWISSFYGVNISTLAIDPTNSQTIYAGTNYGLYKTTNGGTSWGAVNSGLTSMYTYCLAIDPSNSQTIYAGTYGSGVFKSINGGNSWSAVNSGLTSMYAYCLAIDPGNSQTIYAGTYGGGVFKTTNGGASWSTVNSELTYSIVNSLAIDPTNSQTLYAGTYGGVFKTSNGSTSWGTVNSNLNSTAVISLAIDPANSQTIYAGSFYDGVFKTTTGGTSWSTVNSGLPITNAPGINVYSLAIDPTNSQTIYAATGSGVFKTTNGGTSWWVVNGGLTYTTASSLAIDPTSSQTVYAVTYIGGVIKTTNGGLSWSAVNSVQTYAMVSSLAIDPTSSQTIYAGTSNFGIFKTTNGGTSWSNSGLSNSNIIYMAIDSTNSQILYAGTYGGLFKTTNGGTSWNNSGLTGLYVYSLAIDPTNNQTIYAGTNGGVFKSTNGGTSWIAFNVGLTTMDVRSLVINSINSNTLYAGTNSGGVNAFTLPHQLTVESVNPANGVPITVGPSDLNGADNGSTLFTRSYNNGMSVILTAPAVSGGNNFSSWSGCDSVNGTICMVSMTQDRTVKAGYNLRTLTVASSNPASGLAITASQADVNGNTGGSTHFSLSYAQDTSVTLTAPASAGGNYFYGWAGCNSTSSQICTVSMSADKTVTALYDQSPRLPSILGPTPGNSQVVISWLAVPGATSYNLYYSTTPGVTKANGTKKANVTSPYIVTPLTNGTTYYFVVTAVAAGVESVESGQVSAVPTPPTGYSLADLTGNWEVNGLASGPGAPWWTRQSLNIAADGSFTGTQTKSDGTAGPITGTLQIASNGIVTMTGNSSFQCIMNAGKTFMACTQTWSGNTYSGTTEMDIFTKKTENYSLSDLTGNWMMNELRTPGPWWSRGAFTVSSNGSFSGTSNGSDNSSTPISGTFTITSDGIITASSAQIPASFRCTMDSGKNVFACTDTNSGGDTNMHIFTRKASSYSLADTTGVWQANNLISPTAWWGRGPMTVGSNGSFSYTQTGSDASVQTFTGTLAIDANGIITGNGPATSSCVMGADKTVIACTSSGAKSGDSGLIVYTKQAQSSQKTLTGLVIGGSAATRSAVYEYSTTTFSATAYWSDGSSSTVAPTWSVSPTTYASINSSTGVMSTLEVPANQTVNVIGSYTYGGITLIASRPLIIVNQSSTLNLTLTGSGTGSVNSIPSGPIACTWSPLDGTCSTSQSSDTTLTLAASPGGDSTFNGWSGACSNSVGNCDVLFDADKNLTATFTLAPLARILTTPYSTLLDAYNAAASSGSVIMLKEGDPGSSLGTLNANVDKSVTLRGGYNATYQTNSGSTVILGPVTIDTGTVIFDNVGVR